MVKHSFTIIKYGYDELYEDITEELYNEIIDILKKEKDIKLIQEWTTEYNKSTLYAKAYKFKCNMLILRKEVIH